MKPSFLDFSLIAVPEPAALPDRCQGSNQRGVFVVCQAEEQAMPQLIGFLEKILAAVQLDMGRDTCLLRLHPGESFSWGLLHNRFPAATFLSFGVEPSRLGLRFGLLPYQPVQHAGTTYLLADDINVVFEERQRGGKERAGLLWRSLREIFPS